MAMDPHYKEPSEWRLQKMVMIASGSIGLCLMSIINFATAQIGTFFLVPMCILVKPLKRTLLHPLSVFNAVMGIVVFPLATVLIFDGLPMGYEKVFVCSCSDASLIPSKKSVILFSLDLIK